MDLPSEIWLSIFSFLDPKDLRTIVAPVCSFWWMLSKDPSLWKETSVRIENEEDMVTVSRVQYSIVTLNVDATSEKSASETWKGLTFPRLAVLNIRGGINQAQKEIIARLATTCPRLRCLEIDLPVHDYTKPGVFDYLNHLPSSIQSITTLQESLYHCENYLPFYRKLFTSSFNLTSVTMNKSSDLIIRSLCENQHATLRHFYILKEAGNLTDDCMPFLSLCQSLKTLYLGSANHNFTNQCLSALCPMMTHLTFLKINIWNNSQMTELDSFFKNSNANGLERLELSLRDLPPKIFKRISQACPNLTHLLLEGAVVHDEDIHLIKNKCIHLKSFNVRFVVRNDWQTCIHLPVITEV